MQIKPTFNKLLKAWFDVMTLCVVYGHVLLGKVLLIAHPYAIICFRAVQRTGQINYTVGYILYIIMCNVKGFLS